MKKYKEFLIETGIPIPERRHRDSKYPFAFMEVGDSVLLDMSVARAGSVAKGIGKPRGFKFTVRKIAEGQVRVWRIE